MGYLYCLDLGLTAVSGCILEPEEIAAGNLSWCLDECLAEEDLECAGGAAALFLRGLHLWLGQPYERQVCGRVQFPEQLGILALAKAENALCVRPSLMDIVFLPDGRRRAASESSILLKV